MYFTPVKHCKSAIYPGIREEIAKVQKLGYQKAKEVQVFRGSDVQKCSKMGSLTFFFPGKKSSIPFDERILNFHEFLNLWTSEHLNL